MAKKIEGLESVMNDLAKEYKTDLDIEFLDTGSIILNMVMGGGLPLQKFIEIYSASGYGKSTIVLSICKYLCKQGHKVVYIDAEASIDSLIGKDLLQMMRITYYGLQRIQKGHLCYLEKIHLKM